MIPYMLAINKVYVLRTRILELVFIAFKKMYGDCIQSSPRQTQTGTPVTPQDHSASQEGHLPPDTLEPHSMHTPSPTSRPMVLLLYPT